jgi:hypothetical protein
MEEQWAAQARGTVTRWDVGWVRVMGLSRECAWRSRARWGHIGRGSRGKG